MTPFASVAMLEKLALLKIALCRAPALRSASSACLCTVFSAPSHTPTRVLVPSYPLVTVLPPVTCTRRIQRTARTTSQLCCEQLSNGFLEMMFRVRLRKKVCAFDKQSLRFVGNGAACRVEHTQFWPKLDGPVCKFIPAKGRCFEIDVGKECVDVLMRT